MEAMPALGALALSLACLPAFADVWDTAVDTDDNTGSDNTPVHGTIQMHDLGVRPGPVADQDFYSFEARGFGSYEAIIDGLTGDTGGSLSFHYLASDGTTVLSSGTSLGSASCTLCTQTAAARQQPGHPATRVPARRSAGLRHQPATRATSTPSGSWRRRTRCRATTTSARR